ncbi:MAG: hypothetical protein AB7E47_13640 [Desulfovibrionaceae bacterium]
MRYAVGFDDTDTLGADRGTGKLARWFAKELPDACTMLGVVRQQLLVHPDVPYTSHNSAACCLVEGPEGMADILVDRAVAHLAAHALDGSDPGLCVVAVNGHSLDAMQCFGYDCTQRLATQGEAMRAAGHAHVSGHGGTNDGIIGAVAGVGLTLSGWAGRFIEYGALRSLPDTLTVAELREAGIDVMSLDRDATVPNLDDTVLTRGWCRPRLCGGKAVLPLVREGEAWASLGHKRGKQGGGAGKGNGQGHAG